MTKMFEYGGIAIFVYPNDHDPVHCHAFVNGINLRVFLPSYRIEKVCEGKMPNVTVLKRVVEAVKENRNIIGKEWRRFHGN